MAWRTQGVVVTRSFARRFHASVDPSRLGNHGLGLAIKIGPRPGGRLDHLRRGLRRRLVKFAAGHVGIDLLGFLARVSKREIGRIDMDSRGGADLAREAVRPHDPAHRSPALAQGQISLLRFVPICYSTAVRCLFGRGNRLVDDRRRDPLDRNAEPEPPHRALSD